MYSINKKKDTNWCKLAYFAFLIAQFDQEDLNLQRSFFAKQ